MLSKIIQKKFQIIGVISLLSGLTGLYAYLKYRPKKKNIQQQPPTRNIVSQLLNDSRTYEHLNRYEIQKSISLFSDFYFDKNLQSRKVLDHLDNQGIKVQTVYKYSPIIAVDQYIKFTKQIRRRRRLIRTVNEDQYIKMILQYQQQVDELLQRSRQQIVYECEVDPQQFQNMKHIFQATEDLTILIRESKRSLKELGFSKKRLINKCVCQKIINEELSFIKSKLYDRLRIKLQNEIDLSQDDILKVIQSMIDDVVYQKYGYERQQIQNSLQNQWSSDLVKQIRQLKKTRQQLQSDIGNFSLASQQSQVQSVDQKKPSSQITRSGANSIHMQEED